ncbi:hypothetical protein [Salinisphaera sp. Q1T1-3]|uniref:hypothetical protein n=1 Tax=Salinisphaera sp. Q1T1-3 TaxID=2321229 RepID=UPI0011C37E5A|nr:hypothetical protein [Salinisphaera sp. Q1T1-3]
MPRSRLATPPDGICGANAALERNINRPQDYLGDYDRDCQGLSAEAAYLFPVGGGGGGDVSVYTDRPTYQQGIAGMQDSAAGQTVPDYDSGRTYTRLPNGFVGRNVPDVSMNADTNSGYLTYTTIDGGQRSDHGGTSFVAPQLAKLIALGVQRGQSRYGLINPRLYALIGARGYGTGGAYRDIDGGHTNGYWPARSGYDPAVGAGTPRLAT